MAQDNKLYIHETMIEEQTLLNKPDMKILLLKIMTRIEPKKYAFKKAVLYVSSKKLNIERSFALSIEKFADKDKDRKMSGVR